MRCCLSRCTVCTVQTFDGLHVHPSPDVSSAPKGTALNGESFLVIQGPQSSR